MSGHGHSHGHGHSCEGDSDSHESPEMGIEYSLFSKIDMANLECLNETNEGSGKTIFKPWEERLSLDKFVESDADEELLFNIPFTGNIKLKGIIIVGGECESHPSKMRLFKNRPKMTFDDARCEPDQEFDLQKDSQGVLEYSIRVVKFSSVHHLSIHLPSNFGCETTRVYYIGLRGEWMQAHRHGVTICMYESAPSMADHKNPLSDIVQSRIG